MPLVALGVLVTLACLDRYWWKASLWLLERTPGAGLSGSHRANQAKLPPIHESGIMLLSKMKVFCICQTDSTNSMKKNMNQAFHISTDICHSTFMMMKWWWKEKCSWICKSWQDKCNWFGSSVWPVTLSEFLINQVALVCSCEKWKWMAQLCGAVWVSYFPFLVWD